MSDTNLVIGGKEFSSRLIVGTGKYSSMEVMKQAHEASGAQIITVALRRVSLPSGESLLDHLDTTRYTLLPNTAGCYTADEAIRTCYLAREAGLGEMVKLEVIGDPRTLFPDVLGLLEATKTLAREGFTVMPYTNDDPVMAKKLEDAGAAVVMPLGAPIGSGLGIRNPYNIKIILETVSVPVIVDAGVGTASDAAIAMELGCEGVLMNTAISGAQDPVGMARAMRLGFRRVIAFPYFLFTGVLVKRIYRAADSCARTNPGVEIVKAPYLNDHPLVIDTFVDRVALGPRRTCIGKDVIVGLHGRLDFQVRRRVRLVRS